MRTNAQFTGVFVLMMLGLAVARELPEFLHVCNRNDPNLVNCITKSVESLKPYLMKGVPEYNIPTLEPLLLKELVASEGTGGLKITAKNVLAYGASDFTVTKLKVDLPKLLFTLDVNLPNLHIRGMYEIDGKVLLFPIRGSGPMNGNFTGCTGAVKVRAERFKGDDGQVYIRMVDFKMRINVGKGTLTLDNLFGGEKALGDIVNSAINNNFDSFLKELQPLVERALSEAFLDIANSIVSQFSYDQLFPNA